ncbi:MAG TPA: ATP-binding cassette domain-containing protein [Candidatus Excrementavichristensenella intestinipullorum]|nr:ATP-binding cassette domain-containing protein [Candidatus Excrementavichristensenella intestinipullorum]
MAEIVLKVENLTKHFPVRGSRSRVVHAVDGVSFEIARGQTLGLVGESGCGKSTCARTIIRIYEPTAGRIELCGKDITALDQKQLKPFRRDMQMIFQDPYASLNARMTVRDIISEPLRAHGLARDAKEVDQRVNEMLASVGLSQEHARRYAHEFSGGQRQRVGIARALILNPRLVICDEPISALDVSIQAQVVNLLRSLQQKQGLTYLFIAHDLSMVRYVSDQVGVMYIGRLVEKCAADEIYAHPLHPYTQGLMGAVPVADPRLSRQKTASSIEGDLPSPIDPPQGCRFCTRCPRATQRCREEEPPFQEAAPGHYVACFHI